jgi:predicted RNase H-like nuclease (RuvC/YqgF family)
MTDKQQGTDTEKQQEVMKNGYIIQIDELKNKVHVLESELGELEDKVDHLKEIIKSLAEAL